MVLTRGSILVTTAAWLAASAACATAATDPDGKTYVLAAPPSALEVGCQGPCACPIVTLPTYGSFHLVKTGVDPLYTYYAVENYIASFNNGPGAVAITGSGQYKIGGEVALVQEMTLDLDIQGQPTEHFDSGLKPVGVPFPGIDVSCAVHGFTCYDSVLIVSAKPADPVGALAPPTVAGLQAVEPNPFAHQTRIAFALDRAGPAELRVLDLAGRRVRVLAPGQSFGQGPQAVTWDGRRDDGRVAAAGVYWVSLRWPGGADRRCIVKLD
jgi:hypothetical protein